MADPIQMKRQEFAILLRNAKYVATQEEWMEQVRAELLKMNVPEALATPSDWVAAAEKATVKCPDCRDGTYYFGACVNGRMTNARTCVRCQGKGRQNQSDFRRNWTYDNFHRKVI